MDSEHRHELKTNELADWIAHIPQFISKNYLQIIGVCLIIAAVLLWGPLRRSKQKAKTGEQAKTTLIIGEVGMAKAVALQKQAQGTANLTNTIIIAADKLEGAANTTKLPTAAAMALIKRGEALRTDLHYKIEDVEEEVILDQIEKARLAYTSAIEKAAGDNTLIAMAKFGLGLCAEEVGQIEQAKNIYKELTENTEFEGTGFVAQAQLRIDSIDDNAEKFTFIDAPVVIEEPPAGQAAATIKVPGAAVTEEATPAEGTEATPTEETPPAEGTETTPAEEATPAEGTEPAEEPAEEKTEAPAEETTPAAEAVATETENE